jgi:hypothetical protein
MLQSFSSPEYQKLIRGLSPEALERIDARNQVLAKRFPLHNHLPSGFKFDDTTQRMTFPDGTLFIRVERHAVVAWLCQDPALRPGSSYLLLLISDFNLPCARHLLYFGCRPGGRYVPHGVLPVMSPHPQVVADCIIADLGDDYLQLAFAAVCRYPELNLGYWTAVSARRGVALPALLSDIPSLINFEN